MRWPLSTLMCLFLGLISLSTSKFLCSFSSQRPGTFNAQTRCGPIITNTCVSASFLSPSSFQQTSWKVSENVDGSLNATVYQGNNCSDVIAHLYNLAPNKHHKLQHWFGFYDSCPLCRANGTCGAALVGKPYTGHVSKTVHGRTCQPWSSQTPHSHSIPTNNDSDTQNQTPSNYCRNPQDKFNSPWCFTTDKHVRVEYCLVDPACKSPANYGDACTSDGQLVGNGLNYRGAEFYTFSGLSCIPWLSETADASFNQKNYPNSGLEDGPYCRNPDGKLAPWCFVDPSSGVEWEYCDPVKMCTPWQATLFPVTSSSVPDTPSPTSTTVKIVTTATTDEPTEQATLQPAPSSSSSSDIVRVAVGATCGVIVIVAVVLIILKLRRMRVYKQFDKRKPQGVDEIQA
eukprot:m.17920 g.17920  ORF g.17920 m.17920 type:complete len:400 (-) comp11540_c0_seq1:200-1399(-)